MEVCFYVSHLCSVQGAVLFLTTSIKVIVGRHDMLPLIWGSISEGANPQSQEVMLPLKQDVSSPTSVTER